MLKGSKMPKRLAKKVAIVTGASRGIGRAGRPHRRGFRTTDFTDYWAMPTKDVYYYSYSIIQIGKRSLFYESF